MNLLNEKISDYSVVLASKSPRRRELLSHIITDFKIVSADINEEFEIESIPLPTEEVEMNKAWSDPNFMFDWMFGIDGDRLTRNNNFIYFPGTIFRKELYDKIGSPDFKNFGGSGDFEYWARAVFNGYKFKYLGLPIWYYMQSSYSHSKIAKDNGDDRVTLYSPRIKDKYQNLWLKNDMKIRDTPRITEDIFWS